MTFVSLYLFGAPCVSAMFSTAIRDGIAEGLSGVQTSALDRFLARMFVLLIWPFLLIDAAINHFGGRGDA